MSNFIKIILPFIITLLFVVSAYAIDHTFTFVWDANVETITGYRLYQSTDRADFELIDTVEDTTADVTVDILNHRYEWYVTAYITENEETFESAPSNRVGSIGSGNMRGGGTGVITGGGSGSSS